jgi:transcriptional regulator with XRE-family HTH domain
MSAHPTGLGPAGHAVRLNIRRLRQAQHMTTAEMAEKLASAGRPLLANGVTKVEKGGRRVDVDDLVAFAAALGVAPGQLLATFECAVCEGVPPAGFACRTCGAEGT